MVYVAVAVCCCVTGKPTRYKVPQRSSIIITTTTS